MDRFVITKSVVLTPSTSGNKIINQCTDSTIVENTDNNTVTGNKPLKKRFYKQKYRQEWQKILKNSTWLMSTKSQEPFCKVCKKVLHGSITHLKRHENSIHHKKSYNLATTSIQINNFSKKWREQNSLSKNLREADLRLGFFVAEHNVPFRTLEHLPQLIKAICPDSLVAKNISCSRTKGTNIVLKTLAPKCLIQIIDVIKHNKFSIIIDECTDISSTKSLGVVVRSLFNNTVKDMFITLLELESSTAESIFTVIINFFAEHKVPLTNIIGLAADNAAVMMGRHNSIQSRFQHLIPNIFVFGCICHSFNLCASEACLELPKVIEDLARDIYAYFAHSSKRIKDFKLYQNFCSLKPHKLLAVAQTRWLSLEAVVNRILEQWPALTLFFTNAVAEDHLQSAFTILSALNNPIFKAYYCFLSYVLKIVNKMNLQFQSEKPQICSLLNIIESQYRLILKSFLNSEYVSQTPLHLINVENPHQILPLKSLYLGAQTELVLSTINKEANKNDIHSLQIRCLRFYQKLCFGIRKRFNFDSPILRQLNMLNPECAVSGNVTSIVPLIQLFPNITDDINVIENINSEWRLMPEAKKLIKHWDKIELFWTEVGEIKDNTNSIMFPNLTKFVKTLLCLPHSSAATERIFSKLNDIKIKKRNKLKTDTCNALLLCKEHLILNNVTCYTWNPNNDVPVYMFGETDNCGETEDENDVFFD